MKNLRFTQEQVTKILEEIAMQENYNTHRRQQSLGYKRLEVVFQNPLRFSLR